MSKLTRADLNQVRLDGDSFIGKAVAAGLEYEQLPARFMDTLVTYLRVRGMGFAQSQRVGIALGKEQLREGIEMGLVCIDLALQEETAGDLNKAVELLAGGKFAKLYDKGWERSFQQMEAMRAEAIELARRPQLGFWPEDKPRVEAWAQIVPETWSGTDAEGAPVPVDWRVDRQRLRELSGKVAFLRSLPGKSVNALLKKVEVDFTGVLYRVIVALATGRVGLVVDKQRVFAFRDACFAEGVMLPAIYRQVSEQIEGHLQQAVEDTEVRAQITTEFRAAVESLERAVASEYLDELFLPPEQFAGAESALAAAKADAEDGWMDLQE